MPCSQQIPRGGEWTIQLSIGSKYYIPHQTWNFNEYLELSLDAIFSCLSSHIDNDAESVFAYHLKHTPIDRLICDTCLPNLYKKQLHISPIYLPVVSGCILLLVIFLYPMFTCVAFFIRVKQKKAVGYSVGKYHDEGDKSCCTVKSVLGIILLTISCVLVWFVHTRSLHYVVEKNQDILLWKCIDFGK